MRCRTFRQSDRNLSAVRSRNFALNEIFRVDTADTRPVALRFLDMRMPRISGSRHPLQLADLIALVQGFNQTY